ncbi:sulfite exporter TauE/SafE family protein [Alteromonas ponticola]|uniref:Probable membrane transporter protein n=1 Tax=Alteromonas aquimaris TaxID=2998417 RepID=A0ABT3P2B4_9ALTE|nr:sulfite exporter TauE/SafE family protein [Alteromonas aquimaris]MCW8106910.1 sulfite exporter TauE/SafE family protein [Alteromonas aquimaris]
MLVLGYIAALIMGLVLGVLGGGGSILTVPILVYLMGISPDVATGYSLLIVGATAALGAVGLYRDGLVELKTSIIFAIPSIIAVYLTRAFLMPAIPEQLVSSPFIVSKDVAIMVAFAALMIASAAMMLKRAYANHGAEVTSPAAPLTLMKISLIVLEGAIVGVVTGILGAGGGFLIVPALVLLLGMPMKKAVGASLFIIALKSLIGFVGDLQSGIELQVPMLLGMLIATFVGMFMSRKVSGKFDGPLLQKIFAYFTLIIGLFIVTKELFL